MKHVRDVREPGLIYQAWSIKPILCCCYFFVWPSIFASSSSPSWDSVISRPYFARFIHLRSLFAQLVSQFRFSFARQFVFVPTIHSMAPCIWNTGEQEVEEFKWQHEWEGHTSRLKKTKLFRNKRWEKRFILVILLKRLFLSENFLGLLVFLIQFDDRKKWVTKSFCVVQQKLSRHFYLSSKSVVEELKGCR